MDRGTNDTLASQTWDRRSLPACADHLPAPEAVINSLNVEARAPLSDTPPRIVRFGVFEADLASGELRKRGLRLRLQEQPWQVLTALLEQPGEVVTRETLIQRLWPEGIH